MYGVLIKLTGSVIVIAAMSFIVYNLKCLDNERISDPNYECYIEKKRREMKRQKEDKLKRRLLKFPISSDMKDITHFVIQEVNHKCISM